MRLLTFTRAATAELAGRVGGTVAGEGERLSTNQSIAISVLVRSSGAGDYPQPLRFADDCADGAIVRPTLARRMQIGKKLINALVREMQANWESRAPELLPELTRKLRARFEGAWREHRQLVGSTRLSELPDLVHQALIEHPTLERTSYDLPAERVAAPMVTTPTLSPPTKNCPNRSESGCV